MCPEKTKRKEDENVDGIDYILWLAHLYTQEIKSEPITSICFSVYHISEKKIPGQLFMYACAHNTNETNENG